MSICFLNNFYFFIFPSWWVSAIISSYTSINIGSFSSLNIVTIFASRSSSAKFNIGLLRDSFCYLVLSLWIGHIFLFLKMSSNFLLKFGHVSQYTVVTLGTGSVPSRSWSVSDMVNSGCSLHFNTQNSPLVFSLSLASQKLLCVSVASQSARIPQKLWKPQSQLGLTPYSWICVRLKAALTGFAPCSARDQ